VGPNTLTNIMNIILCFKAKRLQFYFQKTVIKHGPNIYRSKFNMLGNDKYMPRNTPMFVLPTENIRSHKSATFESIGI
jgi:hypothetical protein